MKKILCPTDFSATADKAIQYAATIAQKLGAHLTLLHVVHLPIVDTSETAMVASEMLGEQKNDAINRLEIACKRLHENFGSQYGSGFACEFVVREALLTDAIKDMTEKEGYDLVVMGTTGAGNRLEELLIGSNAETVIEDVNCAVLAIPAKAATPHFRQFVYASDYQENDKDGLIETLALAQPFGANIEVVHVCSSSTEANSQESHAFRERLHNLLPGVPLTFHEVINDDEEKGLNNYLNKRNSDLLVMLRKRKSFFRELFSQSLAEKMTYHTHLPLLVVRGNKSNR